MSSNATTIVEAAVIEEAAPVYTRYVVYDANPITIWILIASMLLTPFYLLMTYAKSRANLDTGIVLASIWMLTGAFMTVACLVDAVNVLGPFGNLIIPAIWILPSALLALCKNWALAQPLHPRWVVGLQLYRAIGGVFLIEMANGYVPAVFAYPAGLGDIFTAVVALFILVVCPRHQAVPSHYIYALFIIGILDFISAFFFGFTSGQNDFQLFFPENPSELINFPTCMVPLYLVPYAIFFHTLSILNHWKHAGDFDYETDIAAAKAGTEVSSKLDDPSNDDVEEGRAVDGELSNA